MQSIMRLHTLTSILVLSTIATDVASAASYVQVNYTTQTNEGDGNAPLLVSYATEPPVGASESKPVPAVIVVHDLNGIDEYELDRIGMIADDLGYVGFAADIYGYDYHGETNRTILRGLATYYRDNMQLFVDRMQAAVNRTKELPYVDPSKIAIIGYCFGGTGVLGYAFSGLDDVTAVVSFHGGLRHLPDDGEGVLPQAHPKVLVHSGGDDDTSTSIAELEGALNAANSTWEITRYSDVEHAFTNFYDTRGRYDERADTRSWESMRHFLSEAFGESEYESNAPSVVEVEEVKYDDNGFDLVGYVARPAELQEDDSSVAAVVVVPDWDGITDYEKARVQMLADAGYVGFAADIYGPQYVEPGFQQRVELTTMYRDDMPLFVSRIQAAVNKTREIVPYVDKVAIIGYCFGGTGVIGYGLLGMDDVDAIVSFHGGLTGLPEGDLPIVPPILVHSGGDDDTSTSIADLETSFNDANATWEITRFSQTLHGFTNFYSTRGRYHPRADARSWESMHTFFQDVLMGDEVSSEGGNSEFPSAPRSENGDVGADASSLSSDASAVKSFFVGALSSLVTVLCMFFI